MEGLLVVREMKRRMWWKRLGSLTQRKLPWVTVFFLFFLHTLSSAYLVAAYLFCDLIKPLNFLKNFILLIMLLQLSQFFPLCPPLPSTPHSLKQSPHHFSYQWVMQISSLATPFPALYFTSPWLFYNYLFVLLNPLTSSPQHILPHLFLHTHPHTPPIWKPSKCSLYL